MKNAKATLPAYMLRSDKQGCVLGAGDHQLAYAPYGFRENSAESMSLGFNGQLRDVLSGHYLLGNGQRVYNPVLMRFHSPDTLSPFGRGGINAYMYCAGDPLNNQDPSGHIRVPFARKFPLADWAQDYVTASRAYLNGSLPTPPARPQVSDRAIGQANAILKSRFDYRLEQLSPAMKQEAMGLLGPQIRFQPSSPALDKLIKAGGDELVFRYGVTGRTIAPLRAANFGLGQGAGLGSSASSMGHAPSAPPMPSGSRQPSAPPLEVEPPRPSAPPLRRLSDVPPPSYNSIYDLDSPPPSYATLSQAQKIRHT